MLVRLPNNMIVNMDQVVYMNANGNSTYIYFACPHISGNSSHSPGGAGSGNVYSNMEYINIPLSLDTVMEYINKEVALVHALEEAAGKTV